MTGFIKRFIRWTHQPHRATPRPELKPAFIVAPGLNRGADYMSGQVASFFDETNSGIVTTKYGVARNLAEDQSSYVAEYNFGRWAEGILSGEVTILLRQRYIDLNGGTFANFFRFAGGTSGNFKIQSNNAADEYAVYFDSVNTSAAFIALDNDTWYDHWITWRGGEVVTYTVINLETGAVVSQDSATLASTTAVGSTDELGIGRSTSVGAGNSPHGDYVLFATFNRKFPLALRKSISADLYNGIFLPQQRIIPVGVVAAASGRIMSSLAGYGGLAGRGGIAGQGGGLAA